MARAARLAHFGASRFLLLPALRSYHNVIAEPKKGKNYPSGVQSHQQTEASPRHKRSGGSALSDSGAQGSPFFRGLCHESQFQGYWLQSAGRNRKNPLRDCLASQPLPGLSGFCASLGVHRARSSAHGLPLIRTRSYDLKPI
jgi:hypothetical protein